MALSPATVLIISHPFHPSNEIGARRTTALARYLADSGIRVLVVSAFGDQTVQFGSEIYPGVTAVPVKRPRRPWLDLMVNLKRLVVSERAARPAVPAAVTGETHDVTLAVSLRTRLREGYFRVIYFIDHYKKWSWRASKAAVRAGREHHASVVLASGPPHSTLLAGAWAARQLGVPYVADMRDPWADGLARDYPGRRIELRLLRLLDDWVLRQAAAVTSTSATAAALLTARSSELASKVHVIRNGYDGDIAPGLTRTGGRLSILFAGVLYVRRSPYPLLAALEKLLARPDVDAQKVRLTFMGDKFGDFSAESLDSWLRGKRCAAVVRILPPQSAEAVALEVAQATVLLNLAQQQHLHVPAKTYEQLASGREVLLICENDCETAQIVAGIAGVTQVDESDPEVLVNVLLDLYNRHVIAGTATVPAPADVCRFSRAFSNDRFRSVLTAVAKLPVAQKRTADVQVLPGTASSRTQAQSQGPMPLSRALRQLRSELLADARFYHRLRRGGDLRSGSLLWTVASNRGLWLLGFHRVANLCLRRRNPRSVIWWVARLCKSVGTCFSVLLCRSQLSDDCEIGAGVYLSNQGYLLCGAHTIGTGSLIHDRCIFGHAVADGGRGRPTIGKNAWIGPNCIIAGAVSLGDGVTVLPGSVLTFSVPPRAVVNGNPARVLCTDFDNSGLRRSLVVVSNVTSAGA